MSTKTDTERLTVEVDAGTKPVLRNVALVTGYSVKHGRWAGQGSIAGLLEAIAKGDVICVPKVAVDAAKAKE